MNTFSNADEKQLNELFTEPVVAPPKSSKVQYVPTAKKNVETRDKVKERAYDQRLNQARELAEHSMVQEDLREQQLFRQTKMKLIEGNETIIRDVDAILHTQAQERQLSKEKTFIDYEMNTFVPLHAQIENDVDQRFTKQYREQKIKESKLYVENSHQKGQNLENIDASKYDPYAIKLAASKVKYDDPMFRQQKLFKEESKIEEGITDLTRERSAKFLFEQRKLGELLNGADKMKPLEKANSREIIDVRKWNQIDELIVIPSVLRGKKIVGDYQKESGILSFSENMQE